MNEMEKPSLHKDSFDNEKKLEEITAKIFTRQTPEEYKKLISDVKIIELSAAYAENLYSHFYKGYQGKELSDLGQLIVKTSKNGIVLDLGCGQTDYMSRFFSKNKSKLYIGVDLNPYVFSEGGRMVKEKHRDRSYMAANSLFTRGDNVNNELPLWMKTSSPAKTTEGTNNISNTDQIDQSTVYRLKENVLQVKDDMLEAILRIKDDSIDSIIISGIEMSSENIKETNEYLNALIIEVKRVLKESGIILIYQSDFFIEGLKLIHNDRDNEINIYRK